jgi:hypothetical protein
MTDERSETASRLIRAIDSHSYLYLTAIQELEGNRLRLRVKEARASGKPESIQVGGVTLKDATPILVEEAFAEYEVEFEAYIAYSVRNEGYTSMDGEEEREGRLFCVYQRSKFLDYVRASTFASDEYPGRFTHYGLNCLDHIVDVASVLAPEIRILGAAVEQGDAADGGQRCSRATARSRHN